MFKTLNLGSSNLRNMLQKSSGPLLIIFCCFFWASDTLFRFPLTKSISATQIVFYEHLLALVFLFPTLFLIFKNKNSLKKPEWFSLIFIGIFGSGIATIFLTKSYQYINPSVALILQKLQPIISISFAALILKEKITMSQIIWGIFALLGAFVLVLPEINLHSTLQTNQNSLKGILYSIAATSIWGLCTVFGRFVSQKVAFQQSTALRFLFGFIGVMLVTLLDSSSSFSSILNIHSLLNISSLASLASLAYLSIVSGVIAMNLYYAGLSRTPASKAAILELSMPVFAIILNSVFLNKFLSFNQIIGAIIILISIYKTTQTRNLK